MPIGVEKPNGPVMRSVTEHPYYWAATAPRGVWLEASCLSVAVQNALVHLGQGDSAAQLIRLAEDKLSNLPRDRSSLGRLDAVRELPDWPRLLLSQEAIGAYLTAAPTPSSPLRTLSASGAAVVRPAEAHSIPG